MRLEPIDASRLFIARDAAELDITKSRVSSICLVAWAKRLSSRSAARQREKSPVSRQAHRSEAHRERVFFRTKARKRFGHRPWPLLPYTKNRLSLFAQSGLYKAGAAPERHLIVRLVQVSVVVPVKDEAQCRAARARNRKCAGRRALRGDFRRDGSSDATAAELLHWRADAAPGSGPGRNLGQSRALAAACARQGPIHRHARRRWTEQIPRQFPTPHRGVRAAGETPSGHALRVNARNGEDSWKKRMVSRYGNRIPALDVVGHAKDNRLRPEICPPEASWHFPIRSHDRYLITLMCAKAMKCASCRSGHRPRGAGRSNMACGTRGRRPLRSCRRDLAERRFRGPDNPVEL